MSDTATRTLQTPSSPLAELLGPLTSADAVVEANRCLYCYDAPCAQACPTHIDIPGFIRKIAQGRPRDAAKTILSENLLGATCSRVCPVQELCEGACVMGHSMKPIAIGRLQRYATDTVLSDTRPLFTPAAPSGKRIAVVGAGPAGLSCAGELARNGHQVEVFEKRELPGGLSTYGIVTLREPIEVALAEVELIRRLGVVVHTGRELGKNLAWGDLETRFDAVFLAIGLGKVPLLGIPGDEFVVDGLELVEAGKVNPAGVSVGRRVAVVGAGNTAIDCATVAKRLGAEEVTIVYRRTSAEMTAYPHEYEFAKAEGIGFRFLTQPAEVIVKNGTVQGMRCQVMSLGAPDASGRAQPRPVAGEEVFLDVDMVVSAIGQTKPDSWVEGLAFDRGFLAVDDQFQTSRAKVFAGGDGIRAAGAASTVMAVQDGKLAARSIHAFLTEEVRRG